MMPACVGYVAAQERLLEQAVSSTCGLSWAACGMAAARPLPLKRQPWYEHCSVPSDGSILPCDRGASLQQSCMCH